MIDTPNIDNFSGKQITVFGANRSGIATARLLHNMGAEIIVTDIREADGLSKEIAELNGLPIQFELGGHTENCIAKSELIVVSPGVPLDIPILGEAKDRDISILGELEISSMFCPAPIVAITGTKGKSTTTLLTAAVLEESGLFSNVVIAGNIGVPLASKVENITSQDIVVIEASSFQLESTFTFRPAVSVVLNISRDHLDRHKTMESYIEAKTKICTNQTASDWIVLNAIDPTFQNFANATRAKIAYWTDDVKDMDGDVRNRCNVSGFVPQPDLQAYQEDFCGIEARLKKVENRTDIIVHKNEEEHWICNIRDIPLTGAHNIRNALAATVVGTILNATPIDIGNAITNYQGSHPAHEHAFEKVRTINGVDYINDSKATNVIATYAALESIEDVSGFARSTRPTRKRSRKRILLIMGGYDKGNDYKPLTELVKTKVKKLILLGEHTQNIQRTFAGCTEMFHTLRLEDAVEYAHQHASPGDTVLLSPANASFDMFTDYKARGEAFRRAVNSQK